MADQQELQFVIRAIDETRGVIDKLSKQFDELAEKSDDVGKRETATSQNLAKSFFGRFVAFRLLFDIVGRLREAMKELAKSAEESGDAFRDKFGEEIHRAVLRSIAASKTFNEALQAMMARATNVWVDTAKFVGKGVAGPFGLLFTGAGAFEKKVDEETKKLETQSTAVGKLTNEILDLRNQWVEYLKVGDKAKAIEESLNIALKERALVHEREKKGLEAVASTYSDLLEQFASAIRLAEQSDNRIKEAFEDAKKLSGAKKDLLGTDPEKARDAYLTQEGIRIKQLRDLVAGGVFGMGGGALVDEMSDPMRLLVGSTKAYQEANDRLIGSMGELAPHLRNAMYLYAGLNVTISKAIGEHRAFADAAEEAANEYGKYLDKLEDYQYRHSKDNDPFLGMSQGIEEFRRQIGTVREQFKAFAFDAAQGGARAFSQFFFDVMQGRIRSLKDAFRALAQFILTAMQEVAAKAAGTFFAGLFVGGGLPGEKPPNNPGLPAAGIPPEAMDEFNPAVYGGGGGAAIGGFSSSKGTTVIHVSPTFNVSSLGPQTAAALVQSQMSLIVQGVARAVNRKTDPRAAFA